MASDDRDLIRRLLPYMTLLLVVVLAYSAWTWYSRRSATRAMEERNRPSRGNELPPEYLGDKVKILSFTIDPAVVRRGQSAQLCFSVLHAKSASFEPSVGDVAGDEWGRTRCVQIKPVQTTTYKLTANGSAAGDSQSASLTIVVH
jgi:hypothetical protein